MFIWNPALYMDEKVKEEPKKFRRRLERRKLVKKCYCITLPINEQNCLDIYSSREFWFQYYRKRKIHIVGLAADQEGVEEILQKEIGEVFKKVLEHAGVYKNTKQGMEGFMRFISGL